MWSADNYDTPDPPGSLLENQSWPSGDLAHRLSVGESGAVPVNRAAEAWDLWRTEISELGGKSPLIHFSDTPENQIDISRGHPGGLARFLAGSPTLLANLIRDDVARRPAHNAAGRLVDHALEMRHARGLEVLELGIGLVEWENNEDRHCGPLLIRPIRLRRRGSDFEITLKRAPVRLNPGLQDAFEHQLKLSLDASSFVALTHDEGAFKPNPALDRLRDLTAHRPDVRIQARLIISSFCSISGQMLQDSTDLQHPVLDALGGNQNAIEDLRNKRKPVEIIDSDSRATETDRLIVDSDVEQDVIIQNILEGNSLVVRAFPGTGATQTVVNTIGALAAERKKVLVVSSRTSSINAIKNRLAEVGLKGLGVSFSSPSHDLVAAISRNEKAKKPTLKDVDLAHDRLRSVILKYREALTKKDPELSVSAMDCFANLGTLSLLDQPPETTARLDKEVLTSLSRRFGEAAALLARAAELGEFTQGPDDTPWFGVSFQDSGQALLAQQRALTLSEDSVPKLLDQFPQLLQQTPLPPAATIAQIGQYLKLLLEIRQTLDQFLPTVFDRSVKDLITATGPKELSRDLPRVQRQRLRALAKEHIRPGVSVSNLHECLVSIDKQRDAWLSYVDSGHQPAVPSGLSDVAALFETVGQDLNYLDRILGRASERKPLSSLPFAEMSSLLAKLGEETEILYSLEDKREVQSQLEQMKLGSLVRDLASRHTPVSLVRAELELAWWRGALEKILEQEEALLRSDRDVLARLEADFKLVDEAHSAGSSQLLAWQLSERWSMGLLDWPEEANELRKGLKNQSCSFRTISMRSPHLARILAPVCVGSPYLMHLLPETTRFDAVIVTDAGSLTVAESIGALRRAPQVVAVGDPVAETPAAFSIGLGMDGHPEERLNYELHSDSLFARLSELLPVFSLTKSHRASGDELAKITSSAFYGGRIKSTPWAGSFLGHPSVVISHLENGFGRPDPESGNVEAVEAEVQAVLESVIDHVATRPGESLMVLTASSKHSRAVRDLLSEAATSRADLAKFITADSQEPFVVATLGQADGFTRDRVIFSLGYGRTRHGRVVSDLGPLSAEGGERLLAAMFTSARRHLRVITCVSIEDLRDDRLTRKTRALGDILQMFDSSVLEPKKVMEPDPLLDDLSRRLENMGISVELGYKGIIPLAARFGGYCIAVDTDRSLNALPVREALRSRPAAFTQSGWHYLRIHALELFASPDEVANRIGVLVGLSAETESGTDSG